MVPDHQRHQRAGSGGPVAAGTGLKIWTPDDSPNLQFQVEEVGGGYFKLTNRTNGLVLDGAGLTEPGANPVQTVYTGATTQQWTITDTASNVFTIANRASGLVLDSGGDVGSGSPLKLWSDNGSPNLRWQLFAV